MAGGSPPGVGGFEPAGGVWALTLWGREPLGVPRCEGVFADLGRDAK